MRRRGSVRLSWVVVIVSLCLAGAVNPSLGNLIAFWHFNGDWGCCIPTFTYNASQGSGNVSGVATNDNFGAGSGSSINDIAGNPGTSLAFRTNITAAVMTFSFSTSGMQDVVMTFAAQRTATLGFVNNKVEYSTDGGSNYFEWGRFTAPLSFGLITLDMSNISAIDNKPNVLIRWTFDRSFRGGSGGGERGGPDNNFDNVQINANVFTGEAACCLGDGSCTLLDFNGCTNAGGSFMGEGTDCNAVADADSDGSSDFCDECDSDPAKVREGQCGCGVPDDDADSDGVADCNDVCAGFADGDDGDGDGVPDGCDACPGYDDNVDCNTNSTPDGCDIAGPTSDDCDGSGVPDECESGRWIGSDGGSFNDGGAWDPSGVPNTVALLQNTGPDDNRCVLPSSDYWDLCRLSISATGAGRQILEVQREGILNTHVAIDVLAGGEIALRGGELSGAPIFNQSNTLAGYGRLVCNLVNTGLAQGYLGQILELAGSAVDNQPGGMIRAPIASIVHVQSPDFAQAGALEVRSNATLAVDGLLANQAGGLIQLFGGTLGAPSIENQSGATISGFGTIDQTIVNDGEIIVIADLHIIGDLQNDGTVTIQSGLLTITGDLSGSGVIVGGLGGR